MEEKITRMPLIGDDAPAFTVVTTQGVINFPEDYKGKWVILFSPCRLYTSLYYGIYDLCYDARRI